MTYISITVFLLGSEISVFAKEKNRGKFKYVGAIVFLCVAACVFFSIIFAFRSECFASFPRSENLNYSSESAFLYEHELLEKTFCDCHYAARRYTANSFSECRIFLPFFCFAFLLIP